MLSIYTYGYIEKKHSQQPPMQEGWVRLPTFPCACRADALRSALSPCQLPSPVCWFLPGSAAKEQGCCETRAAGLARLLAAGFGGRFLISPPRQGSRDVCHERTAGKQTPLVPAEPQRAPHPPENPRGAWARCRSCSWLVPFAPSLLNLGKVAVGCRVFTSLRKVGKENCQGAWGVQLFPAVAMLFQ